MIDFLQCIFAVTLRIIFAVDYPDLTEDDKQSIILQRHMSYFADADSLNGLLRYLGDECPLRDVFEAIDESFD